jgi:hypothetical protein
MEKDCDVRGRVTSGGNWQNCSPPGVGACAFHLNAVRVVVRFFGDKMAPARFLDEEDVCVSGF